MNFVYNFWLVILSFVIAAVASFTALELTKRVRTTDKSIANGWWVAGSLAMGTGIWAMHFIGMLAVSLPIEFGFAYGTTFLSWVAAVLVSAIALGISIGKRLTPVRLMFGALTMGSGISAMHYTGMLAMTMNPAIRWSVSLVTMSVGISILASALALLIFFHLPDPKGRRGFLWQFGASVVLAIGITGMHYVGMAAAEIPANSICQSADALRGSSLVALIAGSTISLLALTLIVSAFDRYMSLQRARLEVEVTRRTADLSTALETAKVANLAKNEFIAAISHELRTPLTSIRGFSELMELTTQDSTIKTQASLIRKGAEHLNDLLTDILDFSKIQAGAIQLHYELTDSRKMTQGIIDFFTLTASSKKLTLKLEISSDVPKEIMCDKLRVKQILSNLLSNALKFTSAGEVGLNIERKNGIVLFHVWDTGVGIPENLQEIIFEKFRQANERISHDHGGTGLGLALSRDLAHLMHGTLVVQSEVGIGSRFTLTLPLSPDNVKSNILEEFN